MVLEDVSDAPHGERFRSFLQDMCGKTGTSPDLTQADWDLAYGMATTEMLEEVHFMLRELLRRTST